MILKFLSNQKKSMNWFSLWFSLGSCLYWSNWGPKLYIYHTAIKPPELEVMTEIMVGKRFSLVFCSINLTEFYDAEPEGDGNKIYLGFHQDFRSIWLKLLAHWHWLVKPLSLFALCLLTLFKIFFFCITIVNTSLF